MVEERLEVAATVLRGRRKLVIAELSGRYEWLRHATHDVECSVAGGEGG